MPRERAQRQIKAKEKDKIPDQARNDRIKNKMLSLFCHPEFISGSLDLLILSDSEKILKQPRNKFGTKGSPEWQDKNKTYCLFVPGTNRQ